MRWALLVIGASCSFQPGTLGSPPAVDDATIGDPDSSLDAPPDAPPTWQVIETLTINSASSTAQTSTTVLANGVVYHLRASGTLSNVIDPHPGDADYFDFTAPKDKGCCEDIGLGINDVVVADQETQPNWGPYSPNHIYEIEWTGAGATITALFQDTFYDNNVGNLTLEILELR